jgi:hypothetical protein
MLEARGRPGEELGGEVNPCLEGCWELLNHLSPRGLVGFKSNYNILDLCVRVRVRVYIFLYMYIYIYILIYTHVCVYIFTCIPVFRNLVRPRHLCCLAVRGSRIRAS